MEIITMTALATFVGACLTKAGEKFSEKVIETSFESRQELKGKFIEFFKPEFTQLNLSESTAPEEITGQLEANPEIVEQASNRLKNDTDLFNLLREVLRETSKSETTINNFANQTNNDKSMNIVGDNTNVTF
jgi:hypothetical protein